MGLGPEAAGSAADWITASLCDGEDEKSDQLDKALRELDDEGERARRLKIRAQGGDSMEAGFLKTYRDVSAKCPG